jgi:HAD superfamily hydrolase (TIGR01509 family)
VVKAALFDLDGLMIDSESIALEAWQRCLSAYGARMTYDQHRRLIGTSHGVSQRLIAELTGIELPDRVVQHDFWVYMIDLIAEMGEPLPGLLPLVEEIAARGIVLGVASNSPTAYVQEVLRQIGVAPYFAAAIGSDEVAQPKPAPDVYLRCARLIGVAPEDCLAFEDSPTGAAAAVAAGAYCVLIPNFHLTLSDVDVLHVEVFASLADCHAALDDILDRASRSGG